MKASILIMAAVAASCVAGSATAQSRESRVALGANVGTTGLGIEAQFKLSPKLTLRGGFDSFQVDEEVEGDDILYDGEIDFSTGGAFIDFHPTGGAFFVSAGAFFGDRQVTVSGTPTTGIVEIGDDTFTAAQVGTLQGNLDFGGTAPFIGLGWNNTFTSDHRWGLKFLVGAAFGDDPDATLTRVGGSALSPTPGAGRAKRTQVPAPSVDSRPRLPP